MRRRLALALFLFAVGFAGLAMQNAVAQSWPVRPVKVIVGFTPGGPTDLVARLLAQKLSEQTGKNFYIENLPGAGGNVGAVRAAQSPPDGYTLLVTGGNITNNPFLFANPGYDPIKDFAAVTLAAATPVVLAVNPEVPAHTVKELVAWVRANPGKESFASPGTGTPPQLVGSLFAQSQHLDLVHVPFNGGGSAVEATVGGHTPISFGAMAPAVPLIKAGQLRALAVTGNARSPALPRGGRRDLDRNGGAGADAAGHRRQTSRHDRQEPRHARHQRQTRRHGLRADRRHARGMRNLLQVRDGQVGQGDQGRRAEGGVKQRQ
jgi:tripartite-type tricarboxylate transporter receptor subunit TctC